MAISPTATELEKPAIKTQEQLQEERKKAEDQKAIFQKRLDKEASIQTERKKAERKTDESRIKILLLGARHLASHLVFAMRNHATFTVIDRLDPEYIYQNPLVKKEVARRLISGYQISEMDIERNLTKILEDNEFDFIINTISLHDAGFSAMNPNATMYINTMFTQGVINAIVASRRYNPNIKLLHMSSDKIYGDVGCPAGLNNDHYWDEFMIDEKEKPNPLGLKAISRYNQEVIVTQLCKTYDIDYMVLRLGNLWGRYTTRNNMLNNMIISGIRDKKVHIYGDPWASRHLLNVEDLSEFVRDLLNKNYDRTKWNQTYNVGGHCPTRMYVWGYAQWVMSMLSGNAQKDLDPKAGYFLPYMSVRVENNAPRWFEDSEEAKIRIWMVTKKAEDELGYVGERDIRWDLAFKELMLFNAAYYVGYSTDQINAARSKITYNIQR